MSVFNFFILLPPTSHVKKRKKDETEKREKKEGGEPVPEYSNSNMVSVCRGQYLNVMLFICFSWGGGGGVGGWYEHP